MKKQYYILLFLLIPQSLFAQVINKPRGCFAGTNGTHPAVLSHTEVRGVLLVEKWSAIEPTPGVYDFTNLNTKINTVKAAGVKYSLAISGGAFGSPDWLIDMLKVSYHNFQYQSQDWRLPLWWDPVCNQKLTELITQLGSQYAADTMLSHVYVTQMTVNGIEGHLNGVDMTLFASDGFTNEKWITAAKTTTRVFANAFPDKPIVFEVHEIDQDTIVPATIMNDLADDPGLCNRVGLGMWWISGKTTYQTDLIDFIYHFQGDKYAQIIGRSDQPERFKDGLYSSVFTQAKYLNIRYIEPWPFEFQYHTYDPLMTDFNIWADTYFSPSDTCILTGPYDSTVLSNSMVSIYPNPTCGLLNFKIDFPFQKFEVKLFNLMGKKLLTTTQQTEVDISDFPEGMYLVRLNIDDRIIYKKLIRME